MAAPPRAPASAWQLARRGWDQLSMYMPLLLMGLLALGTYWLARNTPTFTDSPAQRAARHEPDYFMRGFSVKSFDPSGRLKSEIYGTEARHYPDTDTLEIDKPRIRSFNERGVQTVSTAERAVSNADGSQVQLVGNAVVVRESAPDARGEPVPRMEIRSEFLHAFIEEERVTTHRPVVLIRGQDRFSAETMDYDNLERALELKGRVRGTLTPTPAAPGAAAESR